MDVRITISPTETYLEMLTNCMNGRQKVSMLLDEDGLTRAEGIIRTIQADTINPYIEMEDGAKIVIKNIVAVNGVFHSSYSEC